MDQLSEERAEVTFPGLLWAFPAFSRQLEGVRDEDSGAEALTGEITWVPGWNPGQDQRGLDPEAVSEWSWGSLCGAHDQGCVRSLAGRL